MYFLVISAAAPFPSDQSKEFSVTTGSVLRTYRAGWDMIRTRTDAQRQCVQFEGGTLAELYDATIIADLK